MTADPSLLSALGIGFLLGLRHATDADHIAAVSTFISWDRSLVRSCLVGSFWGAGHTAALLTAGVASIIFKMTISPALERTLEIVVALVLIVLGGHVLLRSLAPVRRHRHAHTRGGTPHGDADVHRHRHVLIFGRRPFLVGLLHGLAGSAALTLLALATISSPLAGVLYIVVFGVGSTAGMLAVTGVIALPFVLTAGRADRLNTAIRATAGAVSVVLGVWLVWPSHG
jgi:ABC-type nickel/cobalt efflux system permease component RcnA